MIVQQQQGCFKSLSLTTDIIYYTLLIENLFYLNNGVNHARYNQSFILNSDQSSIRLSNLILADSVHLSISASSIGINGACTVRNY